MTATVHARRDCLFSVHLGMCRGRRLGVEGGGGGGGDGLVLIHTKTCK